MFGEIEHQKDVAVDRADIEDHAIVWIIRGLFVQPFQNFGWPDGDEIFHRDTTCATCCESIHASNAATSM